MASSRIKGVRSFKSRGKTYHYHRASGKRLREPYGTAAFLLEVAGLDKKEAAKAQAGTLQRLVEVYKASLDWQELAPATQISYERAIAAMAAIQERPLKEFTPPFVAAFRDIVARARKRWMANYVLTVMIILFDHAREKGWVTDNPAKGVKRIKRSRLDRTGPPKNRPWTTAETRSVLDAAPPYLAVPIGLAMFAGFRKGDVLDLRWKAVMIRTVEIDGESTEIRLISHVTAKRSVDVAFPIHPTLANIVGAAKARSETPSAKERPAAATPEAERHIAVNSRDKPWTESGFNSTFSKFIDRLEREGAVGPGLTMHGLRHTVGTRLREAGADLDMIQALLGQQSAAMAKHYSKTADVTEKAVALVGRMKVVGDAKR